MFSLSGNNIRLTRGDSLYLDITLTKDGEAYIPDPGDVIRFAMKKDYRSPNPVLVKNIPIETLQLVILPSDTKDLMMGTDYVYDIELTTASGDVDTFLSGKFSIGNEVL